ncbi:hypothetical protein [Prevotella sp. HMSC077E09]|uniref:hypothetical protein n=1 Tax=Prevotella sp. HMSC077E09 TaxID=1739487 RepID=UPI0008A25170|nr:MULTISPECIES: hypothetical protein [unclassified Prevotella]
MKKRRYTAPFIRVIETETDQTLCAGSKGKYDLGKDGSPNHEHGNIGSDENEDIPDVNSAKGWGGVTDWEDWD